MTPRRSLLLLALLQGILVLAAEPQEQQEPPRPGGPPLTTFREGERERLERELDGAWMLLTYETDQGQIDARDVRGFMSFHAGFMTLVLQAREDAAGIFRAPHLHYTVQAGAYRYRVSEELALQTASLMGYANANSDFVLEFEDANTAREYALTLTKDELVLARGKGVRFTLRRLGASDFPTSAIEALDRARSSQAYPNGPARPR